MLRGAPQRAFVRRGEVRCTRCQEQANERGVAMSGCTGNALCAARHAAWAGPSGHMESAVQVICTGPAQGRRAKSPHCSTAHHYGTGQVAQLAGCSHWVVAVRTGCLQRVVAHAPQLPSIYL